MSSNSQYDKDKQAKIDALRVMKEKQGNISDIAVESSQSLVPKTFKQKWSNYWYHYKFHTIAIIFVSIIVLVSFWNIIFREKFDATFTVISEKSFEGSVDIFKKGFNDIIIDYDNNGKKAVDVTTIQLAVKENSEMTPQMMQMNRTKILGMLSAGETFLFLLDQECYNELKESEVQFKDLNSLVTSDRINGDKYNLTGSKLSEELGFDSTLDNMFLCLIDFDKYDEKAKSKEKLKKSYENEKDFLIRMIDKN